MARETKRPPCQVGPGRSASCSRRRGSAPLESIHGVPGVSLSGAERASDQRAWVSSLEGISTGGNKKEKTVSSLFCRGPDIPTSTLSQACACVRGRVAGSRCPRDMWYCHSCGAVSRKFLETRSSTSGRHIFDALRGAGILCCAVHGPCEKQIVVVNNGAGPRRAWRNHSLRGVFVTGRAATSRKLPNTAY